MAHIECYSPNPETLLGQILLVTLWYTVLDLKDTFFCNPVHLDS